MINTTSYQIYRCIGSKVILEFYLALQFWYSMILVGFDKSKLDLIGENRENLFKKSVQRISVLTRNHRFVVLPSSVKSVDGWLMVGRWSVDGQSVG